MALYEIEKADDDSFYINFHGLRFHVKKGKSRQAHNTLTFRFIVETQIPISLASKNQRRWLNIARELATSSKCKSLHGAVIVKSGRIIGSGFNHDRYRGFGTLTYTNYGKKIYSTHAEIDALLDVGDYSLLRGATMYITRRDKDGNFGYSAPCIRCQEMIKTMQSKWGLSRALFTLDACSETEHLPIVEYK